MLSHQIIGVLVKDVPPERIDDALKLIAVIHPLQRRLRQVAIYFAMLLGCVLLVGTTTYILGHESDTRAVLLAPLVFGGIFFAAGFAAANGQPASVGQMAEAAERFATALRGSNSKDPAA